jgi:hypothetical protein
LVVNISDVVLEQFVFVELEFFGHVIGKKGGIVIFSDVDGGTFKERRLILFLFSLFLTVYFFLVHLWLVMKLMALQLHSHLSMIESW